MDTMKNIKILFVQKISDGQFETEGIWCKVENENYIIDNIPFISKRIALGDIIKAEYDESDNSYYFEDFVSVSGNSTIHMYVRNERLIPEVRASLKEMGCESEVFLSRKLIAVNVPKEINYNPIKKYLDNGELGGNWNYGEACLAHSYE